MQHKDPLSGEDLRKAILTVLKVDSRTAFADLGVGVLNSIAHLAGAVDSLSKRDTAEELAKHVSGICGVVNRIEVLGSPHPARIIHLKLYTK